MLKNKVVYTNELFIVSVKHNNIFSFPYCNSY